MSDVSGGARLTLTSDIRHLTSAFRGMRMRQRKFPAQSKSVARVAPVVLVLFALASSLVPASHATQQNGGRPRRATVAAAQKTAAAQSVQTPTPTPTPRP